MGALSKIWECSKRPKGQFQIIKAGHCNPLAPCLFSLDSNMHQVPSVGDVFHTEWVSSSAPAAVLKKKQGVHDPSTDL